MTADLVTRLRGWLDEDVPIGVIMNEAADRIEQLEAALRPLACTCKTKHPEGCSSGEVDCPFWNARAALKGST